MASGRPSLEDCAHCAVGGIDLRTGRVAVSRYWPGFTGANNRQCPLWDARAGLKIGACGCLCRRACLVLVLG